MKLLLLGATGLVGSKTLALALSSEAISSVIAPTRKALPSNPKLLNPVGARLEDLVPALVSNRPDAVICALGTTKAKAGSNEAFRHVDYALPLLVGKAAHEAGVETFAIVTAMGASTDSWSFYYRTKGEVERDVQRIGFRSLTLCRPSLIGGERNETRSAERVGLAIFRLFAPILPKKLRVSPAEVIAASLLEAVLASKTGCHWIHSEELTGIASPRH